jgi:TolB-like protein
MATVYLARDLRHDRPVALKVLHQELAASLGPERFLREIRITAQLQHPHILPLLDSGGESALLWYTMPYVEGENLRQRIAREKQLGIDDTILIARQVASAIGYAHSRGIIHRDIKPENILIDTSGAMVADFGIARAVTAAADEKLTSTGIVVGTPAYMSPEQGASGHDVDARSDLYSLGCVMYEMLAGQPPFSAPTAQGLLARHAVDPVPSLRTVRPTVPAAVERAVERALAKVPADRFRSADELSAALSAREATVALPSRASSSRRRWLVAAAIVGAAALATAVLLKPHSAGRSVVPSAAVIAVLPFTPSVADTGLERLGRDLVLTVSPTLDGVGDIRTIDAHTVLAQSSDPVASSLEKDRAMGRALGAGSVLRGSVLRVGPQVRLDLGLFTSDSATILARASVTAAPDSIESLTNGVIRALLPQIWRGASSPSPSLDGALKTGSIAALRAFLEGERALVESRWDDATDAYSRAIEADSSFWLAYSRYVYVVQWRYRPVDSTIANALERHRGELPERERLMLESPPDEKASAALARHKQIAERFPFNWFARMEYADNLYHWGALLGHTAAEARAALEETVRLNPRFVPGWEHLMGNALATHDTIASARALDTLAHLVAGLHSTEPGPGGLMQSRLVLLLERGDSGAARALSDSVVRDLAANGGPDFGNPGIYGLNAADLDLQRRLLRVWRDSEKSATTRRVIAYDWAARGAWDSALVAMDRNVQLDAVSTDSSAALRAYRLAVAAAWLGAVSPGEASRRRRNALGAAAALGPEARAEAAWLDGILAAVRRDRRALASAQVTARSAALAAGDSSDILGRSLAGFDLYLTGATARAGQSLAALEWEQSEQLSPFRFAYPALAPIDRLAAAQWLLATGDTTQAARLLTWVDGEFGQGGFTGIALRPFVELERARIEDALGHTERALAHYRRFLGSFDAPMPSQRALLTEAQEAVARLSGRGDPSPGPQP